MKKLFLLFTAWLFILSIPVYATNVNSQTDTSHTTTDDSTSIPSMSIEELIIMMQARQAKVDIIKKNNVEITTLKESLKTQILEAATKVNNLSKDLANEDTNISNSTILELKELLEFLQEAKTTLETDASKVSSEIEEILDLISSKSMQLSQYDLLIEKQNSVIVKMKDILEMVNKI